MENRFSEFLGTENSVLALIDHQSGLLSSVRDIDPDLLRTNLIALAKTAKEAGIPVVITSSMPEGPNGPFLQEEQYRYQIHCE